MVLRDVLRSIVWAVVDADERLPEGEYISFDYSEKWIRLYHILENEELKASGGEDWLRVVSSTRADCENEEQVAELLAWLKAKGVENE